jgi:hypothetical protein
MAPRQPLTIARLDGADCRTAQSSSSRLRGLHLGAFTATLAIFLPPYLLVVFGAPYYRRFAKNRQVKAFVQGVTAAAVGYAKIVARCGVLNGIPL